MRDRFDRPPKTRKTRAEYMRELIEKHGLEPVKAANPAPQLTVKKLASLSAVPPSLGISAAMQSFTAAMNRSMMTLSSVQIDPLAAHELWTTTFMPAYDPIGWACEAVGFYRHEVREARIAADWQRHLIVLEVDLHDTDWEPTYEIPMRELYFGPKLRNPWERTRRRSIEWRASTP